MVSHQSFLDRSRIRTGGSKQPICFAWADSMTDTDQDFVDLPKDGSNSVPRASFMPLAVRLY
jgi:hypothetical protein